MVDEALRGVVLSALRSIESHGLPAGHHLYISFLTTCPGVTIAAELQNQFPDEMTIVLQNQFWNLEVTKTKFRVTLNFNKTPHELVIPITALTGFADPHSEFTLQFGAGKRTANSQTAVELDDPNDKQKETANTKESAGTQKIIKLDSFRKP